MSGDSYATRAKASEIRADDFHDSGTGGYGPHTARATRAHGNRPALSMASLAARASPIGSRVLGTPGIRRGKGRGRKAAELDMVEESDDAEDSDEAEKLDENERNRANNAYYDEDEDD